MRRILVASDLTSKSERAVEAAVRLIARAGDVVRVLHVLSPSDPRREFFHDFNDAELRTLTLIREREEGEALEKLRKQLACLSPGGVFVEPRVRWGDVAVEIGREAREFDATVVVLGGHGCAVPKMGSALASACHRPLLILPCQRPVLADVKPSTASRIHRAARPQLPAPASTSLAA
jgi:nucleotide-binding universal stress UspA family protein